MLEGRADDGALLHELLDQHEVATVADDDLRETREDLRDARTEIVELKAERAGAALKLREIHKLLQVALTLTPGGTGARAREALAKGIEILETIDLDP
jgi:hypothetical protein